MWGLDLGQECLKAVFLQRVSGRYEIAKFTQIDYELPLTGQYPPEKKDILEKALRSFREQEGIALDQPIAIAFSGLDAASLPVRLPPISKRIEDLVDLEVSQNPPIQGKDFVYRFQLLPTDTLSERRVFLVAYPKAEIDAVVEAASRARLRIQTLQSSPASVVNYLRFDLRHLDKTLLVHMRRDATDLVLGTEAGIWFRTIPEGASSLRNHLRRELGVPIAEAREILEDFLRGTPRTPYTIACDEFLDRVQSEIQKALDYQFLHFSFSQPEKVIVLGECARIPGTLTHFSNRFRCWVERVEKAQRVSAAPNVLESIPGQSLPSIGAAIGVALQGMGAVAGTPSFAASAEKPAIRTEPISLAAATASLSQTHASAPSTATTAKITGNAALGMRLARVAAVAALLLSGTYAALQGSNAQTASARLEAAQARIAPAEFQLATRREAKNLQEELAKKRAEKALLASFSKNERPYAEVCASVSRVLPRNARIASAEFSQVAGKPLQGELLIHYPGSAASLEDLFAREKALQGAQIEDMGSGKFRVLLGTASRESEEAR